MVTIHQTKNNKSLHPIQTYSCVELSLQRNFWGAKRGVNHTIRWFTPLFFLRRDRDSNPGCLKGTTVFETAPFDRSGISPLGWPPNTTRRYDYFPIFQFSPPAPPRRRLTARPALHVFSQPINWADGSFFYGQNGNFAAVSIALDINFGWVRVAIGRENV